MRHAMIDEKGKRPDPKVLNVVIVADKLAKGVYRKPKKDNAENGEKGAKDESNHRGTR